jgi:hypothetical protein
VSENRLQQIWSGFAEDDYQGDEPPDLGPLRALAERGTGGGGVPVRGWLRAPTARQRSPLPARGA